MIGRENWVHVLRAEVSQPTQPNPNHYRTVRPVVCSEGARRSSNQEIETRSSGDCKNFNLDADANHKEWRDPLFPHNERIKHVLLVTVRASI